jgi:hypothetical protein
MNAERYDSAEGPEIILSWNLDKWEDDYGKDDRENSLSRRFEGVIRRAYEKTGKRVVVLVDEYDKPMLSAILNEQLTKDYRSILKAFYGVLKSSGQYLRFLFLTGVTKFAKVSVFSDLNHLTDISSVDEYTSLCGITQGELLQNFAPELERLAAKQEMTFEEAFGKMTKQYDGYHFAPFSEGMFNPFSVLTALKNGDFGNYWFQSGTPTFLAELLKKSDFDLRRIVDGIELESSDFLEFLTIDNPIPLIYQSGYLTIQGYKKERNLYTLGLPNDEVRYGFLKYLLPYYSKVRSMDTAFHINKFVDELESGDITAFMERLKVFFAKIPYTLNNKNEKHYQAIFYVVFTLAGQFIDVEVCSSEGRADVVVKTKDSIYAFEFKLNKTAEEAIRQIDSKGYLIPYTLDSRKLVKIGVEFSKEKRNINRYIVL